MVRREKERSKKEKKYLKIRIFLLIQVWNLVRWKSRVITFQHSWTCLLRPFPPVEKVLWRRKFRAERSSLHPDSKNDVDVNKMNIYSEPTRRNLPPPPPPPQQYLFRSRNYLIGHDLTRLRDSIRSTGAATMESDIFPWRPRVSLPQGPLGVIEPTRFLSQEGKRVFPLPLDKRN